MYDDAVEEAIEVAISRTHAAQVTVAEEIESAGIPRTADAERVERRAEDLEGLAHDAVTRPSAGSTPDAAQPAGRGV